MASCSVSRHAKYSRIYCKKSYLRMTRRKNRDDIVSKRHCILSRFGDVRSANFIRCGSLLLDNDIGRTTLGSLPYWTTTRFHVGMISFKLRCVLWLGIEHFAVECACKHLLINIYLCMGRRLSRFATDRFCLGSFDNRMRYEYIRCGATRPIEAGWCHSWIYLKSLLHRKIGKNRSFYAKVRKNNG
jgi:hypothetical protein